MTQLRVLPGGAGLTATGVGKVYKKRPVVRNVSVHVRRGEALAHMLVRAPSDGPVPPGWESRPVGLEELALAYLREPDAAALPGPARVRNTEPSEVRT